MPSQWRRARTIITLDCPVPQTSVTLGSKSRAQPELLQPAPVTPLAAAIYHDASLLVLQLGSEVEACTHHVALVATTASTVPCGLSPRVAALGHRAV
ncbi:hypothetical protein C8R44DRAFT_767867 [Mycena epipterygia]|nr:hypothetical protein C8R44DRAFT_767867 [Mycena epipterygia]